MNRISIVLLFAAAVAYAGIGVIPFPNGEKKMGGIPDAARAIQLKGEGILPASGTVKIGQITKRWETTAIVTNQTIVCRDINYEGGLDIEMTYDPRGWWDHVCGYEFSLSPVEFRYEMGELSTTNYTQTASGAFTNNLPEKTFMRFPAGSEWVRYGTATSGVVELWVEQ